ncbi:MAG: cbb3-type cytochrome c oxidase subunit II [Planctomycetes bacterium]|nr:cbb3-type cytochrome c oxidase subunit II [Planctomycetota bacterium]
MERFSGIFLVAGLAFFLFAFVAMGAIPYVHFVDLPIKTAEDLAPAVLEDFADLERRWPEAFAAAFPGGATVQSCAAALREGRDVYIAEGCWHCHSQYVRPVSNEDARWGRISAPAEYHNELQLPQLFGTRRVGPDLTRQARVHSNDWHAAHFYNPRSVSPTSVMPPFPWLFEDRGKGPEPNRKGLSTIAYVQWLGSWIPLEERNDFAR